MKKFLIGLAVLFAAFCFAGCSETGTTDDDTPSDNGDVIEEPEDEEKILVAYFSCTGNTEKIAGYIAETVEATFTYEIVPAEPYTEEDLDYYDEESRAALEQAETSTARPEIEGELENAEEYDIIYIGYPIWWGRLPKIIYTFFETYDFSGKVIVPFCTSQGTGISVSVEEIKVLEPEANVLTGRRFSSTTKESDVVTWLNTLNFGIEDERRDDVDDGAANDKVEETEE